MWQFEVPNAPCGVESDGGLGKNIADCLFLMHRVELKVLAGLGLVSSWLQFLMHRVELKGIRINCFAS